MRKEQKVMNYQKAITFSYDDGIESDRKLVEIFNRYGMKCTFNLNTGIQSRESHFDIEGKEICRMDQETIGDFFQGGSRRGALSLSGA